MRDIQIQLKNWLSDYCGNVQEYESRVRTLIVQEKDMIKRINTAYLSKDIVSIQEKIKDFLIEKKIWIRKCNKCEKVHYISGPYKPDQKIYNSKCDECSYSLFNKEAKEIDSSTPATRKCIYCGTTIFPPNTMTCYSHKNVEFNLYGN